MLDNSNEAYKEKEKIVGEEVMRQFEKSVILQSLDHNWKEHLAAMDHLRQGIHLRGYAQKDPKQEYKRESYEMFSRLLDTLKHNVISVLSNVQVVAQEDVAAVEEQRRAASGQRQMQYQHTEMNAMEGAAEEAAQDGPGEVVPFVRQEAKVGRNEPCPCGSGKKYKQCHGKLS